MIYSQDRNKIRQQYFDVWKKANEGIALEPMETIIADVIKDHPEYHPILMNPEATIDSEYYPEHGKTNPFLHMGMHITCLLYTSPSPRDGLLSRMPSSA